MRVLHVIPSVAARDGGPSRAVIAMCRALQARGVSTAIATTDAGQVAPRENERGATTDLDVPMKVFAGGAAGVKYSPGLAQWLTTAVRGFEIVHIHAVFSHSSVAAARACRRAGVPYLVRPLGSLEPWALQQKRLKKKVLLWTAVGSMLRHAAAIHYTTDHERTRAERVTGPLPAVIVPLGVDPIPVASTAPEGRTVVTLSRLHPVKNLEVLIEAFLQCWRTIAPDWHLIIAGSGDADYEAHLRQRVKALEGEAAIAFAGWVGDEDKPALLSRAALFALPSHSESFGIGLLEAMSCGIPVVVTRSINLASTIDAAGAGWLADATTNGFAAALGAAMGDGPARARRGEAARRLSEQYTWASVASALETAYAKYCGVPAAIAAPATSLAGEPGQR